MNKKLVAAIMALGLVLTTNVSVLAEPLSQTIKSQKQKVEQNKKSLSEVQNKKQNLELAIEKMDNQLLELLVHIKDTKSKISKTEKDIVKTEKDIEKAEKDLKDQQELFNKRVRAMYVSGTGSYLDVILEADGISDLISRVENVKKVMELDKKIIAQLNEKKQNIQNKKRELDSQKSKLESLKKDNEKKLSEIKSKKQEHESLVNKLQQEENKYTSNINEAQAAIDSAMKKIENARNSAPKYEPSRGGGGGSSASASSSNIVAYASNFLGTPYEWGGNGPGTFDCSGFTKYVYAHFGISLPRVASDQQNAGSPVSRDQLQPGDLVFFGSPAHHVGIYVGDGCYIHAPRTGDVVKVSPLNRSDFSGGTRVR
ncbi:NlpC/P60 family protein [Clostridium rectalis]|uniref:C40 family peptidase n=1 Tax=Clostridium rectalis TaxID=2040295 RepID=UPI000F639F70|nr:C40 family peptidase [Clostridium rectalis]